MSIISDILGSTNNGLSTIQFNSAIIDNLNNLNNGNISQLFNIDSDISPTSIDKSNFEFISELWNTQYLLLLGYSSVDITNEVEKRENLYKEKFKLINELKKKSMSMTGGNINKNTISNFIDNLNNFYKQYKLLNKYYKYKTKYMLLKYI